jgi:hypothetical protein
MNHGVQMTSGGMYFCCEIASPECSAWGWGFTPGISTYTHSFLCRILLQGGGETRDSGCISALYLHSASAWAFLDGGVIYGL